MAKHGTLLKALPKIFIGSSSEALDVAHAIQRNLDRSAEVTTWDQDVFKPVGFILDNLINQLRKSEYVIFVFTADDIVLMRGKKHNVVRDNVIFEMGLAMGFLGRDHVFYVVPRNIDQLHLPSDILGLMHGDYDPGRSDKNYTAALNTFCDQVKSIIK